MKVKVIIEIPAGSWYKYEIDKSDGSLNLDRPLNQPIPENYGFIPGTFFDDGDATDIFVVSANPLQALSRVEAEIQGIIRCTDNGVRDDKIVATLVGDSYYRNDIYAAIMSYLTTYKQGFFVESVGSKEEAIAAYEKSAEVYKRNIDQFLEMGGVITSKYP